MILTCPLCAKRYLVADLEIGAAGRAARCGGCRHVWTARPAGSEAPAPPPRVAGPVLPPAAAPLPAAPMFAARPPAPASASAPVRRNPEKRRIAAAFAVGAALIVLTLLLRPGGLGGVDLGRIVAPAAASSG